MTIRTAINRAWEWIFRGTALRTARAQATPDERHGRAHRQARLLLEVAHRVAEPVEALPPGARHAVLISLYRDAAYWALLARKNANGEPPSDLRASWAREDPDVLLRAAGDESVRGSLERLLVDATPSSAIEASPEDATRARAFVEALLEETEAPRRQMERILLQRWSRLLVTTAVVLAIVFGVRQLAIGPNLAANKPFRTSTTWAGCPGDPGCEGLLFHTDPQNEPWVEFDLLASTKIHRIEVTNRSELGDRAVPLVAEISMDRTSWVPVGRRDADFSSWTVKFSPRIARYVRLRVARESTFHLADVRIR